MILQIENRTRLIENLFTGGYLRHPDDIKYFVIHGTGGGGTFNYIINAKGKRARRYKNGDGLFHYLIERDGSIKCLIDPDKWVYHSSTGKFDRHTIGIELLNPSPWNGGHYTTEQYESLFKLFFSMRKDYPNLKTIISHNMLKRLKRGKGKRCPGSGFDWELWRGVVGTKFNFDYVEKETFENVELIK